MHQFDQPVLLVCNGVHTSLGACVQEDVPIRDIDPERNQQTEHGLGCDHVLKDVGRRSEETMEEFNYSSI